MTTPRAMLAVLTGSDLRSLAAISLHVLVAAFRKAAGGLTVRTFRFEPNGVGATSMGVATIIRRPTTTQGRMLIVRSLTCGASFHSARTASSGRRDPFHFFLPIPLSAIPTRTSSGLLTASGVVPANARFARSRRYWRSSMRHGHSDDFPSKHRLSGSIRMPMGKLSSRSIPRRR